MDKAVLYVHGKGGDASEAGQFAKNCPGFAVIGASYDGEQPWNAVKQIAAAFDGLAREYQQVSVIANSIGAYLSMIALQNRRIGKALFISPVLDMEKLILGMMEQADVTEAELRERGEIPTESGETLSWRYLCFVRENPHCLEHPDGSSVRRKGRPDLPRNGGRLCEGAGRVPHRDGERRALVPYRRAACLS